MGARKRREMDDVLVEDCPYRRCRRANRCRRAGPEEKPFDADALRQELADRFMRLSEQVLPAAPVSASPEQGEASEGE